MSRGHDPDDRRRKPYSGRKSSAVDDLDEQIANSDYFVTCPDCDSVILQPYDNVADDYISCDGNGDHKNTKMRGPE
jgi:hypothetical protein